MLLVDGLAVRRLLGSTDTGQAESKEQADDDASPHDAS
jgi:hypothetical protein